MKRPQYPLPLLSALLLFAAVLAACGRAAPERSDELVVSVRPVAMIAREIAGPETPLRVLVQNGDPHHYAPTVADRAALERAHLAIWLGPQMEGVLAKQMALLPEERQLQLLPAGGYEYGGASADDPHLWLRPRNAAVMAAHIATRLAELEPQRAQVYRRRARDFSRGMANLQKVQNRALWAYRDVPIAVTHDAYGHFFGPAGVETRPLSDSSRSQRGARTLLELRGAGDGCLFGEVPANDRDRRTAENLGLRYVPLDPLASELPQNADYRDLLARLLADARRCLDEVPQATD
ncbi:metal ABC transporter substrate-binding protein [Microbulbifer litoralis]|uniref:metal ABC transporter substrate-binding protein n=1 Tax=Microbulbifer litoralis TaxID=2933965 RepID=UPI002029102C|nr:metal ABC transporter substrate-binding protein [Microbulbifer sp. GX H0434]